MKCSASRSLVFHIIIIQHKTEKNQNKEASNKLV